MSGEAMERLLASHAELLGLLSGKEVPQDSTLLDAWNRCDAAFLEVQGSTELSAEALQRARQLNGLLVQRVGELCLSLEQELAAVRVAKDSVSRSSAGTVSSGGSLDVRG